MFDFARIFIGIFLAFPIAANAINAPEEIIITAAGNARNPYFLPKTIELKQGKSYQFIINNPFAKPYTFHLTDNVKAVFTHNVYGSNGVTQQAIMIPPNGSIKWDLTADAPGLYPFFESSSMNREILSEGVLVVVPQEGLETSDASSEKKSIKLKNNNRVVNKSVEQETSQIAKNSADDDLVYVPYGPGRVKRLINRIKGKPKQYNF